LSHPGHPDNISMLPRPLTGTSLLPVSSGT
jgi:hypothetical protein